MVISVEDKDLRRQEFSTTCWISTAQFLLHYMKVDVPLAELQTNYYNPDPNSASLMSGAGKPTRILKDYASGSGRLPKTISVKPEDPKNKSEVVKVIVEYKGRHPRHCVDQEPAGPGVRPCPGDHRHRGRYRDSRV